MVSFVTGYLLGSEDYYSHVRCYTLTSGAKERSDHFLDIARFQRENVVIFKQEDNDGKPTFCGLDLRSNESVASNYSGHYSTHLFADRAVNIIKEHSRRTNGEKVAVYHHYVVCHCYIALIIGSVPNIYFGSE